LYFIADAVATGEFSPDFEASVGGLGDRSLRTGSLLETCADVAASDSPDAESEVSGGMSVFDSVGEEV